MCIPPSPQWSPGQSWFSRVSVLNSSRVLACTIEKNGMAVQDVLFALAEGVPFCWFPFNPTQQNLSIDSFLARLRDKKSSWRKLIVYRDPMERFLSAYRSKCLLSDGDARFHCHPIFRLSDQETRR